MTHRGPCRPRTFCGSVILCGPRRCARCHQPRGSTTQAQNAAICLRHQAGLPGQAARAPGNPRESYHGFPPPLALPRRAGSTNAAAALRSSVCVARRAHGHHLQPRAPPHHAPPSAADVNGPPLREPAHTAALTPRALRAQPRRSPSRALSRLVNQLPGHPLRFLCAGHWHGGVAIGTASLMVNWEDYFWSRDAI